MHSVHLLHVSESSPWTSCSLAPEYSNIPPGTTCALNTPRHPVLLAAVQRLPRSLLQQTLPARPVMNEIVHAVARFRKAKEPSHVSLFYFSVRACLYGDCRGCCCGGCGLAVSGCGSRALRLSRTSPLRSRPRHLTRTSSPSRTTSPMSLTWGCDRV